MSTPVARRQSHGIRAEQTTITLPREEMRRLRREAAGRGVTVSRYVVERLRASWDVDEAGETERDPIPA